MQSNTYTDTDTDTEITLYDEIEQITNSESEYNIDIKDAISFIFTNMGMSIDDIKPHITEYIDTIKLNDSGCTHSTVCSYGDNITCVLCGCCWTCKDCANKISYGNFAWSKHYCCAYNCEHIKKEISTCNTCKKTYNYYLVNDY